MLHYKVDFRLNLESWRKLEIPIKCDGIFSLNESSIRPNMSDVATPGEVHTAIDSLQQVGVLTSIRFDTMKTDKLVYIFVKGRHDITDDDHTVDVVGHTTMLDLDQTTAD